MSLLPGQLAYIVRVHRTWENVYVPVDFDQIGQGEKLCVPTIFDQIGQGEKVCVPVIFTKKRLRGKE